MKYFEGYRFKTAIAILAKFVEAIFELIIPLFMARLIDKGIVEGNMDVVYQCVIWMLLLTLGGYASALVCQYYASKISQIVGGRIRSDLVKHELSLSTDQVESFSSAVLTNRVVTDVLFIQDMIARVIRLGVRAPFLVVGSAVALFMINDQLAIILIIAVPIFTVTIVFFMLATMRGYAKATKQLDRVSSKISELLSGSRIIRAFSKQTLSDRVFKKENESLYKSQSRVGIISTLSNPFTTLLMNVLLVVLVYVSGLEIEVGAMTQGQTIAVINYCNQLVLTLVVAMNLIMIISRGMTSLKRVKTVLETKPTIESTSKTPISKEFTLEFHDVSFSYPGQKRRVLNNISFVLKEGMQLGIIGLTGSGKSTLVRLIPRFMENSEGVITLNGLPLQTYDLSELRDTVGYVPQSAQFIRGTLRDNITMKRYEDPKKALLDAQGSDILAKGLETMIEEGGKNLSGGQKQRVNIARALVKKGSLLIFDDSFSALDALTTYNLQQVLRTQYKKTAQIVVSQRTSSVKYADWILVLDQGRIVDEGTHTSLLESNEIYRRIDALQSEGSTHDETQI